MILECVQILIIRQIFCKMLRPAESIEIGEHGIPFHLSRVLHPDVPRIREHTHHLLLHHIGRVRKIDAVAQRLAHLRLSVSSRQTEAGCIVRKQSLRLHKHIRVVNPVELAHNLAALLQHRLLVFSHRHGRGLESRDVGSLAHRISKKSRRNAPSFKFAHLDFALHGRIALQTGDSHQIHIIERQLAEFRNHRLDENCDLGRVQTYGKIVQSNFNHVLPHLLGIVCIVSQGLGIRDEHEHIVISSLILKFHPALEGTHVMPDVKPAGRTVASQNNLSHFRINT